MENEKCYALNYWLVTRDVLLAIKAVYEDEIQDQCFYKCERLVDGLFERSANANDVRGTIARNVYIFLFFFSLAYICYLYKPFLFPNNCLISSVLL